MKTFVASNPGLESRFPKTIHFPDYSTKELVAIFDSMCTKSGYTCTAKARQKLTELLDGCERGRGFGNARHARNLFEASVARHAGRVAKFESHTDTDLSELQPEDLDDVLPASPATAPARAAAPEAPGSEVETSEVPASEVPASEVPASEVKAAK